MFTIRNLGGTALLLFGSTFFRTLTEPICRWAT
jgi:hypothetical protein